MIKVSILYPKTSGTHFDLDYYVQKHMPLAIRLLSSHPGYRGVSVEHGLGGGAPGSDATYTAMCHFLFDTSESFMQAFGAHAPTLQADIPAYTDSVPVVQVSEVLLSA